MKKFWLIIIVLFMPLVVDAKDIIYLNLGKSEYIKISVSENITASLAGNKDIQIEDMVNYQSILTSEDDNTYPLYIIYDNNQYKFSDTKKPNVQATYILESKMFITNSKNATTSLVNTCQGLLGVQFINLLKNNVLKIVYIAIPLILVVFSTFDFSKLVFSDDKEGIPGAFKKFGKRIIAAVLIFLIPNILIFLTTVLGSNEVKSCVQTFQTTENIDN